MALKSIEIRPTNNLHYPQIGVFNPEYRGKPRFVSKHNDNVVVHTLPLRKGFSYHGQPPYVDFKTLRAMLNYGVGDIARRVIKTKARSWITPDFVYDNMLNYCYPTETRFESEVYNSVLQELRSQFDVATKFEPLTLSEAAKCVPQDTSSGLPFIITEPGLTKGSIIKKYFKSIEKLWVDIGAGNRSIPLHDCAAFGIGHIGDPADNKVRPVWAYPVSVVIAEAMYAQPIIELLKKQEIGRNTGYGMEMMKGGMEWLHNQCINARYRDRDCKFLMTDYTAFDSSVPAWLIRDCFKIIREKIQLPQGKEKYYLNILRKLEKYFINTPIRNCDGRRILTNHGIPSGSMFTNVIGTMVNFIVSCYAIKRLTCSNPIFDIYFGDDSVMCLKGSALINITDIKYTIQICFGMEINEKKSYWTNNISNVHFLGYFNNIGTPYKNSEEVFASMLFPEYNQDDWAHTMAWALVYLVASTGNNFDVYMACFGIFIKARNHEGKLEKALTLVQSHPRMVRHLLQLGISPLDVTYKFIHNYNLTVPRSDCTKILKHINISHSC